MCFVMSLILTVIMVPVLVPISYYSDPTDLTQTNTTVNASSTEISFQSIYMTQFSISNVPNESNFLFAHAIYLWVLTGMVCWVLYKQYQQFAVLTCEALRDGGAPDAVYRLPRSEALRYRTILVQHMPKSLRTDEALKAYFTSLHVGDVDFAAMDRIAGAKLFKLAKERKHSVRKLESTYMEWVIAVDSERWRRMGKRSKALFHSRRDIIDLHSAAPDWDESGIEPEVIERLRPRLFDRKQFPPKMVDAIDHWTEKVNSVTSQIRQQRLLIKHPGMFLRSLAGMLFV